MTSTNSAKKIPENESLLNPEDEIIGKERGPATEVVEFFKKSGESLPTEHTADYRDRLNAETQSNAALERTMGMIQRAEMIENFAETGELSEADSRRLGGVMAERGWQAVFSELQAGDKVVCISTPAGELSIKSLNSKFGEQTADNIIAARKAATAKAISESGLTALMQDYKGGFFKAAANMDGAEIKKMLDAASDEVNREMTEFIKAEIEKLPEEVREDGSFGSMINVLDRAGYRLSFGVSEVAAERDEKDKMAVLDSLAGATQAAQVSKRLSREGSEYGSEFSVDTISGEIREIDEIVKELAGKSVELSDGTRYDIFSTDEKGARRIDRDLLRMARKGDLHPAKGFEKTAELVAQYVRRLNVIDLVKPFVAEEAEDGTLAKRVEANSKFIAKDKNGNWSVDKNLSAKERRELAAELRQDQKDPRFLSHEFFHKESTGIDNCTYVNVDVLDLGVDLLLEYEESLQAIGRDPSKLREISASAGDKITERMRNIRGKALEVYQKYFGDEEAVAKVGGDEITFAVNSEHDPEEVEKFLIDLQVATGTRVIKTVVGSADRETKTRTQEKRVAEHLAALKKAENGTEMCKKIESKMRLIKKVLENNLERAPRETSAEYEKKIQDELGKMEIDSLQHVVAREKADGGFDVMYREKNKIWKQSDMDVANKLGDVIRKLQIKYDLAA